LIVDWEEQVRRQKESRRVRDTHFLDSSSGRTSENIERRARKQGALTLWRAQKGGQLKTQKQVNK
jgi:hypothetical protein